MAGGCASQSDQPIGSPATLRSTFSARNTIEKLLLLPVFCQKKPPQPSPARRAANMAGLRCPDLHQCYAIWRRPDMLGVSQNWTRDQR